MERENVFLEKILSMEKITTSIIVLFGVVGVARGIDIALTQEDLF